MTPLKAGDIAPKFSLPDQDGEEVKRAAELYAAV